jgi:hypothetical protein
MDSAAPPSLDITETFARDGYHLARGVYADRFLRDLQGDFDRIVAQLVRNGEDINVRWRGENMDALDGGESILIHTTMCSATRPCG